MHRTEYKRRSGDGRRCARLNRGANEAGRWYCCGGWKNSGARVSRRQKIQRRRRQRELTGVCQTEGAMLEPHAFVLPGTGCRGNIVSDLRPAHRANVSPWHRLLLRRRQGARHARRERRQQDRKNRDPGGEAAGAAGGVHRKCCGKISACVRPVPCLPWPEA